MFLPGREIQLFLKAVIPFGKFEVSQKSGMVKLLRSKLPFGGSPPLSQGLWEVWPLEPQLSLTIPASELPLA